MHYLQGPALIKQAPNTVLWTTNRALKVVVTARSFQVGVLMLTTYNVPVHTVMQHSYIVASYYKPAVHMDPQHRPVMKGH